MRCEICGEPSGSLRRCRLCGRRVCARDFEEERGICVACAEALCEVCGRYLSVGYCEVCGRLVCEVCSVERGPALVCVECARLTKGKPGSSPEGPRAS